MHETERRHRQSRRSICRKRVLVAGDLMLDRYWPGEVDRISPEAPVPIVRKVSAFSVPGGAANTACNVAALLRGMLFKRGIDCAHISVAAGRPTTVKLRIVAHNQQVVRIDDEDTSPIHASLGDDVVKRAARVMPRVDAVLVSDYAKGFATAPVVRARFFVQPYPIRTDPHPTDAGSRSPRRPRPRTSASFGDFGAQPVGQRM